MSNLDLDALRYTRAGKFQQSTRYRHTDAASDSLTHKQQLSSSTNKRCGISKNSSPSVRKPKRTCSFHKPKQSNEIYVSPARPAASQAVDLLAFYDMPLLYCCATAAMLVLKCRLTGDEGSC